MRLLHTEIHRLSRFFWIFCVCLPLLLTACGTTGGYGIVKDKAPPAEETPSELKAEATGTDENTPAIKVAILLPLSGQNANLGESMLLAAEMALFDVGHSKFELMPKDTAGTAAGAEAAARAVINDGAKLIIGPVFAFEVKAAQRVAQGAGINMVPFSTDWTLANRNTFLMGFMPFDQVERVVRYATASGYNRIGVISPSDTYGNGVVSAYQAVARPAGVSVSRVERLPVLATQYPAKIRAFTDYDKRQAMGNAHGAPFDAVLLPLGGGTAKQIGALLTQNGLDASTVKRLGTGLMDDPALAQDPSLNGAWFAAPSPKSRRKFEERYGSTYGVKPMRLASLAYDATALAAVLARGNTNPSETFSHSAITNPNGFSGVDGIFRFRADGISERGLAILEFRGGRIITVDEAPDTFQVDGY